MNTNQAKSPLVYSPVISESPRSNKGLCARPCIPILAITILLGLIVFLVAINSMNRSSPEPYQAPARQIDDVHTCIQKCSTEELMARQKRDELDKTREKLLGMWRLFQLNTMVIALDLCDISEIEDARVECHEKCLTGRYNPSAKKILDQMHVLKKIRDDICAIDSSQESKLKNECLKNSTAVFTDILSDKECSTEIANFNKKIYTIDGYSGSMDGSVLCDLFYCPAEVAKSYATNECKKFVFDFHRNLAKYYIYAVSYGIEYGFQAAPHRDRVKIENPDALSTCGKIRLSARYYR